MKTTKVPTALLALIAVCSTHGVNISGVVKNSAGIGLEGVRVRLGKAAIMTTTASDGSFTLTDGTGMGHRSPYAVHGVDHPFLPDEHRLFSSTGEQPPATVTIFDCKGRPVVGGSGCSMTIPLSPRGIHICRVSTGNEQYTFRRVAGIPANRIPASLKTAVGPAIFGTNSASRIDDALLFIKQGYTYYRIPVTKPDTSGLQITMASLDTGSLTDIEGNVYRTVKIGNQEWMSENLRTAKYNDGGSIGSNCSFYNNTADPAEKKKWGALYKLAAATSGKLAPTGWGVPSKADWDTLQKYLISHGYNYDGTTTGNKIGKALAAATDWEESGETGAIGNDLSLNNASGFSALPGGQVYWGASSSFTAQGSQGYWYSSWHSPASAGYPYGWIYTLWWINFDLSNWDAAYVDCSVRLVRQFK